MATNLSTPEREAEADKRRMGAMKGGTLTSVRIMTGPEEGMVVPFTEAEGRKVLAAVREVYEARGAKKSRR